MNETRQRHKLAPILAADPVGYSRLMAADDNATVAALNAARAVFRTEIDAYQGRVVDMAGDSVLELFETAAGAVVARLYELAGRAHPPASATSMCSSTTSKVCARRAGGAEPATCGTGCGTRRQ